VPPHVGGTREKWGGTSKKFRPALRAGIVPPPLANCFRRHWCDVGYLCANFSLPSSLCSRLRPDVHDRQTSDAHHRL